MYSRWILISNGLLIEFGAYAAGTGIREITLPVAYNYTYNILTTTIAWGRTNYSNETGFINAIEGGKFSCYVFGDGDYWITIGY